ncbi:DEAD/DEAH box helicase [Blastochloris viridis]|uniref:DEAD-box ATP-dependent RNA helicase RhpA n=1 Tax=Blastochloris viridis TaxID=1079 RepID=A0A0H5BBL8_BLAVI|nr:DEAD/DEAH box helicase [Blastochloris viridis]ALK08937.1 ATP-dependent RNA helicase RhlE [Blastochloris viridis]BAR97666.1 ATP-dependent RNA helicase Atu1833 [Blastochloris viridis]CUU41598.1 ATP-dependent RNA helicase rhlE [Blastochloris viridis]
MSFEHLGLSDKVLVAVKEVGYTEPTPIQEQAIPHVLAHRDVLGIAQTGTGKTAAFTLPMLTMLEQGRAKARMPRTLILEPTRELAAQVEEEFGKYGQHHKINMALLIGGVSFDDQDAKLSRGVDVLIATPGRLLDHFERGKLLLSGIEILVIDEADRMLDMGFIPDIERICRLIPMTRQTLFFSATMPPEIQRLVDTFLHQPARIEVAKQATAAATVIQQLIATGSEPHEKRDVLRRLIREVEGLKNAIVFCNRKREVAVLWRSLVKHGFNATALHGDMDQRARIASLDSFRTGEATILVASDVAARGLDIPEVSHVFNYDVPHHAEDYIHRIGRTGRAGRSGTAVTLVSPADTRSLGAIEKLTGVQINWLGAPVSHESSSERPARGERGGRGERSGRGGERGERGGERGKGGSSRRPRDTASPPSPRVQPERKNTEDTPRPVTRPGNVGGRSRRAETAEDNDENLFLPAFLLRPTRIKAE